MRRSLSVNISIISQGCWDIYGIVLYKDLVESRVNSRNSGCHSNIVGKKCNIILRDCVYSDVISVYADISIVIGVHVGSMICIRRCSIRVSKSQKNVYIETDSKWGSSLGLYIKFYVIVI